MFCQFQQVLARTRKALRRLAGSAHAPGNEESPDNMAGVYDDWLIVLLAETGLFASFCLKFEISCQLFGHRTPHGAVELVATSVPGLRHWNANKAWVHASSLDVK